MKAVRMHAYGGPSVLRLDDVPMPVPQAGELLIAVQAAGINPLDPKVQAISEVVNAFYAEKTREVLVQMQAVLSKIQT